METLNHAFFFVTDLIISIQAVFIAQAWNIGRFVLIISLSTAAINYAMTGQGLKENLIKIVKAVVFFAVIMGFYPRLIGVVTEYAFSWGHDSVYVHIAPHLQEAREEAIEAALAAPPEARSTFIGRLFRSTGFSPGADPDPMQFFSTMIQRREVGQGSYTVVAPAAALGIVLLVSGEAFDYARTEGSMTNLFPVLVGAGVGFFVMLVGIFAVTEYLMAFLEFMLVASVGVILFPLSLWEGTKFLAEKLIGAIIGFFIKLLFCNITMFMMMFGYISILRGFNNRPFTGQPDEILTILFISFLFFYICRSAPGVAQSLLTGVPSLSAAGAIGTAASALKAGVATAKMAGAAGGALGGAAASGIAKAGFAGGGMLSQAIGAAGAVKTLGGSGRDMAGAAMSSVGNSIKTTANNAKTSMITSGGNLVRSLIGKGIESGSPTSGGASGGGTGSGKMPSRGINEYSNLEKHLAKRDGEGNREKMSQYLGGRYSSGVNRGQDYMVKQEQKKAAKKEKQNTEENDGTKTF